MHRSRSIVPLAVLSGLLLLLLPAIARAEAAPMVGDPAPALAVGRWLKGEPLPRLEPGWVYVVDIWAPWCSPCIGGMPHLSDLEERYRDRKVAVIGLTGDDDYGSTIARAETVVTRQGDRIRYRIAWDRERATYARWMAREKTMGWPWAFVVDRQGRIAWTGHPMEMDPVLEQVVAGTWNLDSAATAYRHRATGLDLGNDFYQAYRAERNADAIARYAALRRHDDAYAAGWAPHYFKLLLLRERRRDDAYAFAREALGSMLAHRSEPLRAIATVVADSATAPALRDLDAALALARRAVATRTWSDPASHAALARVHALRGEWDEALAAQLRAAAAADSNRMPGYGDAVARYRARRL